jgi:hypothetical protein
MALCHGLGRQPAASVEAGPSNEFNGDVRRRISLSLLDCWRNLVTSETCQMTHHLENYRESVFVEIDSLEYYAGVELLGCNILEEITVEIRCQAQLMNLLNITTFRSHEKITELS